MDTTIRALNGVVVLYLLAVLLNVLVIKPLKRRWMGDPKRLDGKI